jgi:hypothetical protein
MFVCASITTAVGGHNSILNPRFHVGIGSCVFKIDADLVNGTFEEWELARCQICQCVPNAKPCITSRGYAPLAATCCAASYTQAVDPSLSAIASLDSSIQSNHELN